MAKRGFLVIDPAKNVLWLSSDESYNILSEVFQYRSEEAVKHIRSFKTQKEFDNYIHKYIKSNGVDICEEVEE